MKSKLPSNWTRSPLKSKYNSDMFWIEQEDWMRHWGV